MKIDHSLFSRTVHFCIMILPEVPGCKQYSIAMMRWQCHDLSWRIRGVDSLWLLLLAILKTKNKPVQIKPRSIVELNCSLFTFRTSSVIFLLSSTYERQTAFQLSSIREPEGRTGDRGCFIVGFLLLWNNGVFSYYDMCSYLLYSTVLGLPYCDGLGLV